MQCQSKVKVNKSRECVSLLFKSFFATVLTKCLQGVQMKQSITEHLDMVARSDDTPASENGGWQVIEWLLWTPSQCQCLLVHVPMSKVIREMKHLIGHICNYVII